jgi:hypothetical protein
MRVNKALIFNIRNQKRTFIFKVRTQKCIFLNYVQKEVSSISTYISNKADNCLVTVQMIRAGLTRPLYFKLKMRPSATYYTYVPKNCR